MIRGPDWRIISDKILVPKMISLLYLLLSNGCAGGLNSAATKACWFTWEWPAPLGFGAIVFTQRAVFFAPSVRQSIAENEPVPAMALVALFGYAQPCSVSLYGYILDLNPEHFWATNCLWYHAACFAFCGAVRLGHCWLNAVFAVA